MERRWPELVSGSWQERVAGEGVRPRGEAVVACVCGHAVIRMGFVGSEWPSQSGDELCSVRAGPLLCSLGFPHTPSIPSEAGR